MVKTSYKITPDNGGERLDVFLSDQFDQFSRSYIQKSIDQGRIVVNHVPAKPGYRLRAGDQVKIDLHGVRYGAEPKGEDIPLNIIFEDDDVLVINKQPGLVVHPGSGNTGGTLVNALINYFPAIKEAVYDKNSPTSKIRPGLVHRLDKDTSGVLIVAKNTRAMHSLAKQIQNRTIRKSYLALCYGWPKSESGHLVNFLGRHPKDRKKMADIGPARGREAVSDYRVINYYQVEAKTKVSLIDFNILTGRTHQIRLQASLMHTPVLGDKLYGTKESLRLSLALGIERQLLHSHELELSLPGDKKPTKFTAPLPEDFENILSAISVVS